MSNDAIVIGAGHKGLTCTHYLAKKGMKVTILEAPGNIGGAANAGAHPGGGVTGATGLNAARLVIAENRFRRRSK